MTTTQHPIFVQLNELGAVTLDVSKAAGIPLMLVGWHGNERLIAVKGQTKKAELDEFRKTWKGRRVMEVETLSEAVSAMGIRILTRRPGQARLGRPPKSVGTINLKGETTSDTVTAKTKTPRRAKRKTSARVAASA